MANLRGPLLALLAIACGLTLSPAVALGGEKQQVVVVVAKEVSDKALDENTLRAIYLKKVFLDKAGHPLIPVNLPPENPLREAFSHSVIHMNDNQLRNYWNRLYFQGVSPPYVLGSQKAVVRFIATTPGAIGYVSPCFVDDTVQRLMVLELPSAPGAKGDEGCPPDSGT